MANVQVRTAIVTGVSRPRGIGQAIARQLLQVSRSLVSQRAKVQHMSNYLFYSQLLHRSDSMQMM